MVLSLPEVGTREKEQIWGMLGVRGLWDGQGVLTWRWQLRHCTPEASHLEGRDRMYKKRVGRGLRFSGWRVSS